MEVGPGLVLGGTYLVGELPRLGIGGGSSAFGSPGPVVGDPHDWVGLGCAQLCTSRLG